MATVTDRTDPLAVVADFSNVSPYPAGGIIVPSGLASVAFAAVRAKTPASAPDAQWRVTVDTPAAGQVTCRFLARRYDKLTAVGALASLPAGVTGRATSGGTLIADSSTHSLTHDHAVTPASGTPNSVGGAVLLNAVGPNMSAHSHTLDLANAAFTTGAGSHTHAWNVIYQHQHAVTNTQTDGSLVELAGGSTVLAGSVWRLLAIGV